MRYDKARSEAARSISLLTWMIRVLAILALVLVFGHPNVSAQTYNARTDIAPQAYPNPVPCPTAGGCAAGGALTGQGYCFTPGDFATQICRATDINSGGSQPDYGANCGGSAETSIMDSSDTRIVACTAGSVPIVLSFNPNTHAIATLYRTQGPNKDGMLGGCSAGAQYITTSTFMSYTQPKIGYAESFNASNNPAICQWDFTSATTMPLYSNGGVTQVVDLSTCVPAMAGKTYGTIYVDDVTVSADDQTFVATGSTTNGQDSSGAVYAIVWNRTNGCRVWRTDTGAVTGAWGPTGTISITDKMYIHRVVLNKGGNYLKLSTNTCAPTPGGCTSATNDYIWNIAALTVTRMVDDSTLGCGHNAIGYTETMNLCSGIRIRPFSSNDQIGKDTQTSYPPGFADDGHLSFVSGNSIDTNPVLVSFYNGAFTPSLAWDNEIIGVRLDGSGTSYRFAHTYESGISQGFEAKYGIGNVSADGKYFMWSSDWNGMLGALGGGSASCTLGSNCRSDLFVAILPLGASSGSAPPPPPTLKITNVT